jgi:archaellum component FlaC
MSQEKTVVSETQKFILPFSEKADPSTKFDRDIATEVAAIFALAEMDREKGGRILSRHLGEKINFIAKIGYPFWLYPLSDKVALFDGLNLSEHVLPYTKIENVKPFLDGLKNSLKNRENFEYFLAEHEHYFEKTDPKANLKLQGLIAKIDLLNEFDSYRKEATKATDQFAHIGLLSSPINQSKLLSATQEIERLHASLEKEIKNLNTSIEVLGKGSRQFHNTLHDEIEAIKQEFDLSIKTEETIAAHILEGIREQYDRKTASLARLFKADQVPLHAEKIKLIKSKNELTNEIEQYYANTKKVVSGDEKAKTRWKNRIKQAKDKLSETEKRLKLNERKLEELEERRASEVLQLKSAQESEIKDARKKIVELEASRDAKILVAKQEMKKLASSTKLISDQIGKLVKLKETDIAQFDKLGIKSFSENLDKALVYVPFYVISYDKETRDRYLIVSPSSISAINMSTKLKAVLGRARIKSFLAPRFKELTSMAENIQTQSQENSIFAAEIKQLGAVNNILLMAWIRDEIDKGLTDLKNQGWLNEKEYGVVVAGVKAL